MITCSALPRIGMRLITASGGSDEETFHTLYTSVGGGAFEGSGYPHLIGIIPTVACCGSTMIYTGGYFHFQMIEHIIKKSVCSVFYLKGCNATARVSLQQPEDGRNFINEWVVNQNTSHKGKLVFQYFTIYGNEHIITLDAVDVEYYQNWCSK